MLYHDYMRQATDAVVLTDDELNFVFLNPDWRYELRAAGLKPEEVSDFEGLTEEIVEDVLKLEVELLNKARDKTHVVMDWLYEIINTAEPVMTDEENKIAAKLIEDMQGKMTVPAENKASLPEGMSVAKTTPEIGKTPAKTTRSRKKKEM